MYSKLYFIVKLKEFKVNYFPWTLSSLNFLLQSQKTFNEFSRSYPQRTSCGIGRVDPRSRRIFI